MNALVLKYIAFLFFSLLSFHTSFADAPAAADFKKSAIDELKFLKEQQMRA